jgi:predicted site-specific integrase-resolvase
MNLSVWAGQNGTSYQTARNWFTAGKLAAQGRSVIVAEAKELDDDLVRDMTEVLTSFCARLYGRRSAKHRATAAISALTTSKAE